MDKKKVKVHIENVSKILGTKRQTLSTGTLEHLQNELRFAWMELSKSDWVSVEDGLPEYGEVVLVVCEAYPSNQWTTNRVDRFESGCTLDNHGFKTNSYSPIITHWKPIEKLDKIK